MGMNTATEQNFEGFQVFIEVWGVRFQYMSSTNMIPFFF